MSFFRKLVGKHDNETSPSRKSVQQVPESTAQPVRNDSPDSQTQTQPMQANQQKTYIPGPPHTNVSAAQNAGMLGGVVLGGQSGVGPGAGAVDGLVVGNFVGQQINQARKHEYWREQALNYQAGLPAAGVGDSNVVSPQGPRDRSSREERRRNRWSRRAERRAA